MIVYRRRILLIPEAQIGGQAPSFGGHKRSGGVDRFGRFRVAVVENGGSAAGVRENRALCRFDAAGV